MLLEAGSFWHHVLQAAGRLDTALFLKINGAWHTSFFDSVFPWWREANTWVPLYLFFILLALVNFGKKAVPWILFVVLTLILTDQISSSLIKNWVQRPRPCRDEFLAAQVRLILNNCSGGYSFPSSHATNHFGFAVFVFITLKDVLKAWRYLFLLWAATISYGQVYVGVHYPIDILCGALLGTCIGYGTAMLFYKKIGTVWETGHITAS